jgi:hypothetical protein
MIPPGSYAVKLKGDSSPGRKNAAGLIRGLYQNTTTLCVIDARDSEMRSCGGSKILYLYGLPVFLKVWMRFFSDDPAKTGVLFL